MDQLASIGVAFQDEYIDEIFEQNVQYYEEEPKRQNMFQSQKQWATKSVYEKYKPVRPWGLGELYESEVGIWDLGGRTIRTPGLYKRADPATGTLTATSMIHTNERIHSK